MNLIAYTDGSSRPKTTKCAGWGWVAYIEGNEEKLATNYGHLPAPSTNNVGELLAAIEVLRTFDRKGFDLITIISDSQYVVKGALEWMPNWKMRRWCNNEGPVKNVEMWKEMDALMKHNNVDLQWVRGHSNHPMNDLADKLANKGSDNL